MRLTRLAVVAAAGLTAALPAAGAVAIGEKLQPFTLNDVSGSEKITIVDSKAKNRFENIAIPSTAKVALNVAWATKPIHHNRAW